VIGRVKDMLWGEESPFHLSWNHQRDITGYKEGDIEIIPPAEPLKIPFVSLCTVDVAKERRPHSDLLKKGLLTVATASSTLVLFPLNTLITDNFLL